MTMTFNHFRWRRPFLWTGGGLAALVAGAIVVLSVLLCGSLPRLKGTATLSGLNASVTIERDALGIPTIHGQHRQDIARATGFIHAQDRFFQMDLLRRSAAGELAEWFGPMALEADRAHRLHRFRQRARQTLAALPAEQQGMIAAYTEGVNAGLADLFQLPFEYQLLRVTPKPWQSEDALLVVYAMYLDLQRQQWQRESARGLLHDQLPPSLAAFLDPAGTEWDTPLQGEPFAAVPPPGSEIFSTQRSLFLPAPLSLPVSPSPAISLPQEGRSASSFAFSFLPSAIESGPPLGSNNWVVAGRLTGHGGALLANDMHLPLRIPNIWYRAAFVYPDADGRERRISGVTLPGTPAIVVGSNGHIAWGYTNSEGDWADLVVLEPGDDDDHYQTPEGPQSFVHIKETLAVRGAPDETLDVLETVWGPVLDRDHRGRRRALRWVAHDPQAVNLNLLALEATDTLDAALDIAHRTGIPAQNLLLASADGHIAWTIIGPIPRRFGHDGRLPSSWADGQRGWSGWLDPSEYPRITDPPDGRLWTANGRVVDGAWLELLGDGGYSLGARARQIRDALLAGEHFTEADFLALQLDDRALFLERWRKLLLATLTPENLRADPRRKELRKFVMEWGDRATVDSVGYRAVRTFRLLVRQRAFAPLIAPCQQADPAFDYGAFRQNEGPLWQLVSRQPLHLLDPRYPDWSALLLEAADATLAGLTVDNRPLAMHTWGDDNPVHIQHPFSRVLPWLSGWLDMPEQPLPGDMYMPRVQTPANGASERLVIAPGREASGILHMPGGQSGHPLSSYYRAGHEAWVKGLALPLEPGPAQHRLILEPGAR
ncbi:MAG TPA: penicillin acylase family protein [Candidatus Competibacteraceae bacterium]|nr:penicillin acylase family protein [Candidatus Competibacteraceae bacterium]